MVGTLLGGIGLFLLGMLMLTDGLQRLAGNRLRSALQRYTRSTLSAVATGGIATAVVQSSSAITLAVIGFAGAGLLTFERALGVVLGANLGTTATAWIVAAVGLKVKMDAFALPLVGVGALARLFGRGRLIALGTAVAGFGLIFVGIDLLQTGMQSLSGHLDPSRWAQPGVLGLAAMVLVGLLMTIVMQSSSAAVTATLAAVSSGAIGFTHAAAMVIGQNVGTTVTAAFGAIGGSAAARRTALAHVTFNLITGAIALAVLPVLVPIVRWVVADEEPAVQLAAFHTAFNLLGVLLFAPVVGRFARFIEARIPDRAETLTARLAVGQTSRPAVLLEAARATLVDVTVATLDVLEQLESKKPGRRLDERRDAIYAALEAVRTRLAPVHSSPAAAHEHHQHVALLHAADHLHRLMDAAGEQTNAEQALAREQVRPLLDDLAGLRARMATWLTHPGVQPEGIAESARGIAEQRRDARRTLLASTAAGELDPTTAERALEAMRWVDRMAITCGARRTT